MVLSREYYVVLPMFGALRAVVLRRRGFLAYLTPVACGLAWQLWLVWRFGQPGFAQSNQGNLTWPLLGIFGLFTSPDHPREIFAGLGVLAMAALCVVLLWRDWRRLDLWLLGEAMKATLL